MKFENSGFPLDFRSMFQMTHEGYTPTNFFIFEIRLVRYLEDPFAKSWVLGRPTTTSNIISRRNVICKNRLFTKKIADFSISFPVRMPLLRYCACRFYIILIMQLFFLFKKACALKIGATLATPSILYNICIIGKYNIINNEPR